MILDDAIAACEAAGLTVVRPRDNPDEQLRQIWSDIMKQLRMAADIAEDGARLKVTHPAFLSPSADALKLLKSSVAGYIDAILINAVVEREPADADE